MKSMRGKIATLVTIVLGTAIMGGCATNMSFQKKMDILGTRNASDVSRLPGGYTATQGGAMQLRIAAAILDGEADVGLEEYKNGNTYASRGVVTATTHHGQLKALGFACQRADDGDKVITDQEASDYLTKLMGIKR